MAKKWKWIYFANGEICSLHSGKSAVKQRIKMYERIRGYVPYKFSSPYTETEIETWYKEKEK